MELKVQSERVLEAAVSCAQARETLKTLFPEFFNTKSVPYGSFRVKASPESKNGHAGTYIAIAHPKLLEAYMEIWYPNPSRSKLKVVVLLPSSNSYPNGCPYEFWESFHRDWTVV